MKKKDFREISCVQFPASSPSAVSPSLGKLGLFMTAFGGFHPKPWVEKKESFQLW
ncbi:hypothetical protein [Dictyobacter arantiisoli]|uniref:hypothetical protein n=1 Tax=Dictyobacter arantiisoli TaxID=2014874 RepID=UPI00155A8307|nr:hypothetical protein [Dictyobacter arantiisoli]